jgi:hypothetical protein
MRGFIEECRRAGARSVVDILNETFEKRVRLFGPWIRTSWDGKARVIRLNMGRCMCVGCRESTWIIHGRRARWTGRNERETE